jgi:hypothetical protein
VGAIDRASSSIPSTLSRNNIPTLQPLSIEKCKYKNQRHKTLKQTFKALLELPKTKTNKLIKSYLCYKTISICHLLQKFIDSLNNDVIKLCQFIKQQNQNNEIYNEKGT